MSAFAPLNLGNEASHRTLIAQAANAALRGETYNTGTLTVSSAMVTLKNLRIGPGKQIVMTPANAEAAGLAWYVAETRKGEADIVFPVAPSGEAKFTYSVVGTGRATSEDRI